MVIQTKSTMIMLANGNPDEVNQTMIMLANGNPDEVNDDYVGQW